MATESDSYCLGQIGERSANDLYTDQREYGQVNLMMIIILPSAERTSIRRVNILPKTYDDIASYQQMIEQLKAELPRIEPKLPIINEEVALLLRYEMEIDADVGLSGRIPSTVDHSVVVVGGASTSIPTLGQLQSSAGRMYLFLQTSESTRDSHDLLHRAIISRKRSKCNCRKNKRRICKIFFSCRNHWESPVHIAQTCPWNWRCKSVNRSKITSKPSSTMSNASKMPFECSISICPSRRIYHRSRRSLFPFREWQDDRVFILGYRCSQIHLAIGQRIRRYAQPMEDNGIPSSEDRWIERIRSYSIKESAQILSRL